MGKKGITALALVACTVSFAVEDQCRFSKVRPTRRGLQRQAIPRELRAPFHDGETDKARLERGAKLLSHLGLLPKSAFSPEQVEAIHEAHSLLRWERTLSPQRRLQQLLAKRAILKRAFSKEQIAALLFHGIAGHREFRALFQAAQTVGAQPVLADYLEETGEESAIAAAQLLRANSGQRVPPRHRAQLTALALAFWREHAQVLGLNRITGSRTYDIAPDGMPVVRVALENFLSAENGPREPLSHVHIVGGSDLAPFIQRLGFHKSNPDSLRSWAENLSHLRWSSAFMADPPFDGALLALFPHANRLESLDVTEVDAHMGSYLGAIPKGVKSLRLLWPKAGALLSNALRDRLPHLEELELLGPRMSGAFVSQLPPAMKRFRISGLRSPSRRDTLDTHLSRAFAQNLATLEELDVSNCDGTNGAFLLKAPSTLKTLAMVSQRPGGRDLDEAHLSQALRTNLRNLEEIDVSYSPVTGSFIAEAPEGLKVLGIAGIGVGLTGPTRHELRAIYQALGRFPHLESVRLPHQLRERARERLPAGAGIGDY